MAFSLDHVGVVVRDLDEAVHRFGTQFGWSAIGSPERLDHLGVTVAYLRNGADDTLVQVVCPTAPGPLWEHLDAQGEGLHHLCYAVDNIQAMAAAMAPGSALNIVRGGRGRLACFLPEPTVGVRIELTEARPSFGGFDGKA
ncbi:MAG: VOC family protein [Chloroflexia bacterium]|nr:VOC family protein [Chloroflexia bacterium]